MMTLEDFAKIVKSTVVSAIENGRVDNALLDLDCLEIILKDKELTEALMVRIKTRAATGNPRYE